MIFEFYISIDAVSFISVFDNINGKSSACYDYLYIMTALGNICGIEALACLYALCFGGFKEISVNVNVKTAFGGLAYKCEMTALKAEFHALFFRVLLGYIRL